MKTLKPSESAKLNRQLSEDEAGQMLKRTWSKIACHLNHHSILEAEPETVINAGRLEFKLYYSVLAN